MVEWRVEALRVIRTLAEKGYKFSSDDIHREAGDPPHQNAIGQVFKEAEQLGIIRRVDEYVVSKRPEAKGRRLPLWTGVENEAVLF